MRGPRVPEGMRGNALKSNLRGYAAAGLEASLHNLLTRARLWRVLTHRTWENTTRSRRPCRDQRSVASYRVPTCRSRSKWRRREGESERVVAFSRGFSWRGFLIEVVLIGRTGETVAFDGTHLKLGLKGVTCPLDR